MPDLSTNRPRPTQERRSRPATAADTNQLGQRVRVQDVARDTSGAGLADQARGAIFGAFGAGLAAFIPGTVALADIDHAEQMHKIESENAELASLANSTALSRPKALRTALETGNREGFETLPADAFTRRAFVDTARQNLSIQGANQLASSPQFAAGISTTDTPEQFVADQIKEQTHGMDPVASEAFAAQFHNQSRNLVAQRKQVIVREAVDQNMDVLRASFDKAPPTTLEQMDQYVGSARTIASPMGPQAEMDAQAAMEQSLLREAIVNGQPWAAKLVAETRPDQNDGLSIAQRYKDTADQFKGEAIRKVGAIQTPQEAQSLQNIQREMVKGNLGTAGQSLVRHRETFGENSDEYLRMLGQFRNATENTGNQAALVAAVANGDYPAFDTSDYQKQDADMIRNWGALMASQGIPEENRTALLAEYMNQVPLSSNAKALNAQLLQAGDERTVEVLSMMGDGATDALPTRYKSLWEQIERNPNTNDAIRQWQENQAQQLPYTRTNSIEKSMGLTKTKDKIELYDRVTQSALETSEITADQTGFFVGLDADDPDEVSPRLKAESERVIREVIMDHPNLPQAEIEEIASKRLSREIGMERVNGENKAIHAPMSLRGSTTNQNYRLRSPDGKYLEEGDAWMNTNIPELNRSAPKEDEDPFFPDLTQGIFADRGNLEYAGTLRVDPLTARGYGLSPEFQTPEGNSELVFESGTVEVMPQATADSEMFSGWPAVENPEDFDVPEGSVALLVPDIDTTVRDRLGWVSVDGETHLRYLGEDVRTSTEQRLNKDRTPAVFSGQQSTETNPVRRQEHEGKAANDLKDSMITPDMDAKAKTKVSLTTVDNPGSVFGLISSAYADTNERAEYLLDMTGSERGQQFANQYNKFLAINEGADTNRVYDDANGSTPIKPGQEVKGNRTIALGYNMDRGDWDEMSKRIGLSPKQAADVRSGKAAISDEQKMLLNRILAQETSRKVYARYKDFEKLAESFWTSRMSMWHHGVRETPKMDEAIRGERWNDVAVEIIDNSMAGFQGTKWQEGVQLRRLREAALMLGDRAAEADDRLRGVNPYE